MPRLTALDEYFVHQIPEPLPNVVTHHHHWRESLFFVVHPPDGLGDVVILTMAHFPARRELDALQLGMVDGTPTMARHARAAGDDPHTFEVGPVRIDVLEPFRSLRLHVEDGIDVPVALDLTFTARTPPVRPAAGDDAGRPRADLGPEPHAPVRHLRRHLHPRRPDPPRRAVVGPARPLVGDPRPRPLPVLDVAGGAAARRHVRRVALGVGRTAPASTPTAASRRPTAANPSPSSTSVTTSTGSTPVAAPSATPATAPRSPASGAGSS